MEKNLVSYFEGKIEMGARMDQQEFLFQMKKILDDSKIIIDKWYKNCPGKSIVNEYSELCSIHHTLNLSPRVNPDK